MSEYSRFTVSDLVAAHIISPPMDGNHGEIHPKADDYVPDGIPFVMASDLLAGSIDFQKCKFIEKKLADNLRKGFAYEDDVLLSHKATIGRTAIIQKNRYPYVMLTPQITAYRVLNKEKLLPKFLMYYFETSDFQKIFSAWAGGGSTRAYLGITAQLKLPIYVPSLCKQTAIASILGALDDKIDLNRRTNETLEAMARALFRDWFVDFGPTRAKMGGQAPYLAPEIWELFPDRLDDEGKPEGWASSTIGQEVDVIGGSTPSTKNPSFWSGEIFWATPKDLSSLCNPVLLETERKITEAGLSQISSGLLPVRTVLLSSRAPIGYTAITQVPVAINQGFIAMVCQKRLSNTFIWLWTLANMETIHQKANGSTFQEISKANFRPIETIVPTPDLLRIFDEKAGFLLKKIVSNETENRSLAQLRDLLLPKLMSGEIRIRDAEKLVADIL